MARQKTILIDPVNVDADGLAQAQAVAGAGNLTLNGALISGGSFTADWARQIGVLSAGDDTGITFTITGTDADNRAISEVVTGANASTAESTLYFKTVTSIAASGAAAGNVSAGTVDELVTNTVPLDKYNTDPATVSIEDQTGVINITVQETFTDIQNQSYIEFFDVNGLTNSNSVVTGELSNHATALRLKVNSYTNGADIKLVINQNRP